MTTVDDLALQHALDGTTADPDDMELADAIVRAERDLARIRRGLQLVAAEEPTAAPVRSRRRGRRAVAVAGVAAAIAAAVLIAVVLAWDDDDPAQVAAPSGTTAPAPDTQAAAAPATADSTAAISPDTGMVQGMPAPEQGLPELARTAERIVIGRIERVDRGRIAMPGEPEEQGMPYALATIAVRESLKPAGDLIEEVVAFDYDYGGMITPDGSAGGWEIGQDVLVFLVSDAGTVSEGVQPAHLQLLEGARGRFPVVDGQLQAPFTLDDVRAAVAAGG